MYLYKHGTARERLVRRSRGDNYDKKWGSFLLRQRFNVDQTPLPFVLKVNKTYEYVEPGAGNNHNTCISPPGR